MAVSQTRTPSAEEQENRHLEDVRERLEANLKETERRLQRYARDIQEQKAYLSGHRDEMDHIEKIASRQSMEQSAQSGEMLGEKRKRLRKSLASPYFGRLDFAPEGGEAEPIYIGVHHFHDELTGENRVYDWRAPIASLFYDFETGPVRYESPQGPVDGEISLKRQFRIKYGRIELMIDSAVNVVDEVLQDELGRASDDHMKNIVATIQRDQNAIIRNDEAHELIIQGVAGSGKTSIALHRIAYLLYHYKDTLSSKDILIISPNRVFSDYIANVLPELGEETVREIGMEDVADELLERQYRFQTFFEQTNALLEKDDEAMKERLHYKASPEFLRELDRYAAKVEKERFAAEDVWIAGRLLPGWLIDETFRKHHRLAMSERIRQTSEQLAQMMGVQYHYDLMPEERKQLREAIKGMVNERSLRETYKGFFEWLGRPELFKPVKGRLEYADVFPLIYLKMKLEGVRSPWRDIKHLLIDEMQDYTPVQYAVIGRLFRCRKTVLGDAQQSVNPYNASSAEGIEQALGQAQRVTLNKSYRSSYEIARFAQRISPNPDLEVIERHGEEPRILAFGSRQKELDAIVDAAGELTASEHNTLAVICKTRQQARRTWEKLQDKIDDLQLLDDQSQQFRPGVIICTAHMAKGLEFDRVLIPEVTEKTYHTAMDRNLLYVACTRAMHRLTLTHTGELSPILA